MPKDCHRRAVSWVSRQGKQSLFDANGRRVPAVQQLLDAHAAVLGLDLLGQGEFTADGKPWKKALINEGEKKIWIGYAGYTYGYNHPLFAERVHDVLTAIVYARNHLGSKQVDLVGLEGAGHWVLAARAIAETAVARAVADTQGFRFAALTSWDDPDFLPGGAKYFDLPGMAAIQAPMPLWLATTKDDNCSVVSAAYRAAEAADQLHLSHGKTSREAIEWLLK
jgi:hypothetical protein